MQTISKKKTWSQVKMKYKPCGHRVVVLVDVVEEFSAGGILIASSNKDRQQEATTTGTLMAYGKDAWDFGDGKPWARVGDKVVFKQYEGLKFTEKEGDKTITYRIMNDDDVVAVVEE